MLKNIIVCFTAANAVSNCQLQACKLKKYVNKLKMLITLTILIHLLVADLAAQQTPNLSLNLIWAQICMTEPLKCFP